MFNYKRKFDKNLQIQPMFKNHYRSNMFTIKWFWMEYSSPNTSAASFQEAFYKLVRF